MNGVLIFMHTHNLCLQRMPSVANIPVHMSFRGSQLQKQVLDWGHARIEPWICRGDFLLAVISMLICLSAHTHLHTHKDTESDTDTDKTQTGCGSSKPKTGQTIRTQSGIFCLLRALVDGLSSIRPLPLRLKLIMLL